MQELNDSELYCPLRRRKRWKLIKLNGIIAEAPLCPMCAKNVGKSKNVTAQESISNINKVNSQGFN